MSDAPTALVVAAHGRRGTLELRDGDRFPFLVPGRRLQPCCGDHVDWIAGRDDGIALVTGICERRNELQRQPARGTRPEVLAANVSHLLVVVAPEPEPDLFLVDRYLCAAELMDCEAAVVLNKCDLGIPHPDLGAFTALDYPLLAVSGRTGGNLDALRKWLGTGTGVLTGQSGVGKSSLLNALVPEAGAVTGSISASTGEGRHTTTASVLHRLNGGRLIDTPGVRDFVPALPEPRRVMAGFREIVNLASGCRFADCLHLREPDCAVRAGMDDGGIDPRRYESYRRLLNLATKAAKQVPG